MLGLLGRQSICLTVGDYIGLILKTKTVPPVGFRNMLLGILTLRLSERQPIQCLRVIFLDTLGPNVTQDQLIAREVWWQTNVGTLFFGLNSRSDFNRVAKDN